MKYFYLKHGTYKCGLHDHKRCKGIVDEILFCVGLKEGVPLTVIGSLCPVCGRRKDLIKQAEMVNWPVTDTTNMTNEEFANFIKGL